jgi:type I restriction enzyme S subunit
MVDPFFASTFIQSHAGKSYFLRVAKRTTGIASINKSQLSEMPLWLPPIARQRAFAARVAALQSLASLQGSAASNGRSLQDALSRQLLSAA